LAFDLLFGFFRFVALSLASLACFCAARNFAFLFGFFFVGGFLFPPLAEVLYL
jgi:hypothetical protein